MFTKFGQLRSKNIVNPANESQVYSVILKALGLVEPLNNKIQLPFSSPILHDAYGVAMKSPYGFVIRQIIEGNILLALMHEIVIVLRKEIEITEKELKELQEEYESTEKNEDGNGAHKTHRTQEALHSEILTKEEKLDNLKTVSTEYSEFQPHCRNQLSILNAKYIAAIGRDIESAKTEVVERARELGYELNEEEKAIITSMVPIEELREKLLASYQQANAPTHQQTVADPTQSSHSDSTSEHFQIPAAPAPPPVSTRFEAPSGAYLAARRLPDLELRAMMAINANWNRQVHEMMNAAPAAASIPHTPGTTPIPDQETSAQMPPQERTELSALRAEFKAKYEEEIKLPIEDRSPRFQPREPGSLVIHSVQDAGRLLKDFAKTFHSVEEHQKALHALHQGKAEDIYETIRARVSNTNQQLNKEATPTNVAEPANTTPSPSMSQS